MWLDDILARLTAKEPPTFQNEKPWTWGCLQQRERLRVVAEHCALMWPGDLVEIGCYTGGGVVAMAKIAQEHGHRVIAIDPWETGTQDCEGWEHEAFCRNIEPYRDIVDVWRAPSRATWIRASLAHRRLCFAVIDGRHTYEAALSDILITSHAAVVAVDDVLWNGLVEQALQEGAQKTGQQIVRHELCREAYLLRG